LICDLFTSSFTILYLITFSFFAFKMAFISVMNWELGGSVWQQPTPVVVKVSLFIGGVLMILQAISNTLEDLQSLKQETGS
jgi:TRAP-type mannitol/chloroaromatic compound transport system permease small subunit